MNTTSQGAPDVTPDALREWTHHIESVLRGLAHALNNRAAALSAVVELSREPDDDPDATRGILEGEMARVSELVRVVRAIGAPRGDAEAFSPADIVPDVAAVLELHADLRDRAVAIDAEGAPPVRLHRWMLMRALVSLAASSPPAPGDRKVRLTLTTDGDWIVARVSETRSAYAAALAVAMGGETTSDGFRVPTLEAVRRRESR